MPRLAVAKPWRARRLETSGAEGSFAASAALPNQAQIRHRRSPADGGKAAVGASAQPAPCALRRAGGGLRHVFALSLVKGGVGEAAET